MSKRTETKVNCDVCGRDGAKTWLVGTPHNERAKVDLCPSCGRPLQKAFVAGRRQGREGPIGADAIENFVVEDYQPSPQAQIVAPGSVEWNNAQEKRHRNG